MRCFVDWPMEVATGTMNMYPSTNYSTTQKLQWKIELAGIHYLPCIADHNMSPPRSRPLPSIPKY